MVFYAHMLLTCEHSEQERTTKSIKETRQQSVFIQVGGKDGFQASEKAAGHHRRESQTYTNENAKTTIVSTSKAKSSPKFPKQTGSIIQVSLK